MSNKISFKKLLLKEILPQFIVGLILIFLGFAVIFFLLILLFREGLGGFALIGAPTGFGLLVIGFLSTISASRISGWRKILASLLIALPAIILCLLMMVAGFAEDLSDLPAPLSQARFLKVLTSCLALIVPPFIPGIILGWYSYLEGIKKFLIKTVILTVLTLIAIMIASLLYHLLISEAKMSARDINRRTAMENIKVALEKYYRDHGFFPIFDDTSQDGEFLKILVDEGYWASEEIYLKQLLDPQHPKRFYEYQGSENSFILKCYCEKKGGICDMSDGKRDHVYIIFIKKTKERVETIEKEETKEWKTYSNPEANFKFQYPDNWEIKQDYLYKTAAGVEAKNRTVMIGPIGEKAEAININVPQIATGYNPKFCQLIELCSGNYIATCRQEPEILEVYHRVIDFFQCIENGTIK